VNGPLPTLRESFSRARTSLGAFALLSIGGLIVMAVMNYLVGRHFGPSRFDWEHVWIYSTLLGGLLVGNLLALLHVRFSVTAVAGVLLIFLLHSVVGKQAGMIGIVTMMALASGQLALTHRLSLIALFFPIVWWLGAIVFYLNMHTRVLVWEQSKVSAWMPLPLALLYGMVLLVMLYLASHEAYRLALWKLAGTEQSLRRRATSERLRLTRRGWFAILAASVLLFGATAVIAPYLWRTGAGERGRDGETEREEGETKRESSEERRRRDVVDWEAVKRGLERMAREAKRQSWLLLLLLLALLASRPLRRLAVTWYWRHPLFGVSPSTRLQNYWRIVLAGAADSGAQFPASAPIEARVEAMQAQLAARGQAPSEALRQAAELYHRVRYGLGLQPDDAAQLRRAATRAYRDLRRGLCARQRLRAWWRKELG
jgi:hypothetical protein